MNKFLLGLIIAILIVSNALALGVTPGRTPVDYRPGAEKEIEFAIINSEHKAMNLQISLQGEMADRVVLEKTEINLAPSDEEVKLKARFRMPDELSPGRHDINIVVSEVPNKAGNPSQTSVRAMLAVTSQISLFVPYPGKYLDGEFKVSGTEKKKLFVLNLLSRGKEDIQSARAVVHIYDSSGNEIKTLNTNSISIKSSGRGEVVAEWEPNVGEGKYTAKAVLDYDGNEVFYEQFFEVGEFVLDLQQIFVKDFKLGGIAKFDMIVKNKWNELISNAYAEMRVYDKQMNEIASIKSATYDIPAGMQTTMNYYWDTSGISEGLYNSNVILYYSGKKTQQDLKLDVGENKIEVIGLGYVISSESSSGNGEWVAILVIVVVVLAIINLLWFLAWRKNKIKNAKR